MAPTIVAVLGIPERQIRPASAKIGCRDFASDLVFRVSSTLHPVPASRLGPA
jgi:hypothetical protein